jgi:hypothetical protein
MTETFEFSELSLQLFSKFVTERNRAVVEGRDIFFFEGKEVLVPYADYLIEYLSDNIPDFEVHKTYISQN